MHESKRNEQIEGLRGISILIILVFHVIYRYAELFYPNHVSKLLSKGFSWWGEFGVLFFIFISIWYIKSLDGVNIWRYMRKKFFRLYPSYIIAIVFIYAMSLIMPLGSRGVSLSVFLQNITMLNGFWGTDYVDGAHWYITTLLSATLFVYICEKSCTKRMQQQIFYVCWLVIGLVLKISHAPIVFRTIFTCGYVGSVAFISAIKRVYFEYNDAKSIKFNKENLMDGIIICASMAYMGVARNIRYAFLMPIACIIFIMAVNGKLIILKSRVLRWIGMISYPLYLLHQNSSYMLMNLLNAQLGERFYYLYCFAAMLFSIVLAACIYYVWERRIQKFIGLKM